VNYSLKVKECSHYGSEHIFKHGGNRLRCKACGKTQTTTKDTVLYRIQNKDKWVDFVFLMLSEKKALSLNDIRERIPMTLKTAHAWRHKFLTLMVKIYDKLNPLRITSSQVEIDEIYLKFRVKGRLGKEKYSNYSTKTESTFRTKEKQICDEKYQSIFACISDREGIFLIY
jgi:transposase-like protein